jgi:hypothetical protein
VIGADSDITAAIKRREFVPFALAAYLAAAVSTTKIVTVGCQSALERDPSYCLI